MLEFKSFHITLAGIEKVNMIQKGAIDSVDQSAQISAEIFLRASRQAQLTKAVLWLTLKFPADPLRSV